MINNIFKTFQSWSSLTPNNSKSNIFFSRVMNYQNTIIKQILQFEEGQLLFKYLSIPINSSKLTATCCATLLSKILGRISSWVSGFLSFSRRLVFIKSVFYSIQRYQSSIFILPLKIHKEIYATLRSFLQSDLILNRKKNKVSWIDMCVPKDEGGLNLLSSKQWNKAVITRLV